MALDGKFRPELWHLINNKKKSSNNKKAKDTKEDSKSKLAEVKKIDIDNVEINPDYKPRNAALYDDFM